MINCLFLYCLTLYSQSRTTVLTLFSSHWEAPLSNSIHQCCLIFSIIISVPSTKQLLLCLSTGLKKHSLLTIRKLSVKDWLITNKQYLLHHISLSITECGKGIKNAVSTRLNSYPSNARNRRAVSSRHFVE